jgi:hypothetical protein
MEIDAQRIWSFFSTQAEPLRLKVAVCWPSSWAIDAVVGGVGGDGGEQGGHHEQHIVEDCRSGADRERYTLD